MPTYDFRCPNGHEFEHFFRKISDAQATLPCPVCGAVAERQLSGGAGLLFKGSGFYLTDYGKNAHRKPAASAGDGAKGESGGAGAKPEGAGAKGDSKAESKPDSKPAGKPEGAPPKKGGSSE
jgi:putative FmdB family regulatory protein